MKSFTRNLVLTVAMAASLSTWASVEIKGARFNDTYQLANQALQLNGAGVRVKIVVDVYAAGLYVAHKDHNAAALISQPGPKSMHIVLLRDLGAQGSPDRPEVNGCHGKTVKE
ncbi:MAG: chalcone isomerase family protein [Aquabacterium sp.]|nr:chalcone isomerase family protein [Aquabacterium sp.]